MRETTTALLTTLVLASVAPVPARDLQREVSETKLIASDGLGAAQFGNSVSISGHTALIGAWDDSNVNGTLAGAAYVFERTMDGWVEQAKLLPNDGMPFHHFGTSVALSGNTAVVSAPQDATNGPRAGAAYIFRRAGEIWTEEAKLLASDGEAGDLFGSAVAISGDTALIAAYFDDNENGEAAGSAYVFVRDGGIWTEEAQLLASDGEASENFGFSISLSENVALIGVPYDDEKGISSGSAYVFVRSGGVWLESGKLLPNDGQHLDVFGWDVSLSGRVALVGAPGDDDNESFSGSAYVFFRDGQPWIQQAKLVPKDGSASDRFGNSVAVFRNTALVGAPYDDPKGVDSGSAYVFRRHGSSWIERLKLIPSDGLEGDAFAEAVSALAETFLVGTRLDDNENGLLAGAAYAYTAGHVLSVEGACPGRLRLDVRGAEPTDRVVLLGSARLGRDTLDGVFCPDAWVGLLDPRLLGSVAVNERGNFSTMIDLDAASCGLYLQTIGLTNCDVSEVRRLPIGDD